ncbi:hypothetical protein PVA17_21145 [Lysinibacillus sp. CNPSo 3705]|uniref:hypothetical protein n=1 Tax=Lysinibacillus sp. CNPSo 3705 TaxID=3028148 RepID=UPI002364778D|nr:hypothetical protein [Lysinibacillus sp. CNPSo 3705]MDD1505231.1 hypothetical protein [Lysinibacillus sp. CNPSo 3705]
MAIMYRCPMCGKIILYNSSYFEQYPNPIYLQASNIPTSANDYLVQNGTIRPHSIPVPELPSLKGKQIRTTIQNLGTVTACVGDYDASRNRVELSNITSVSNGVNHGDMDFLPEELVGYKVINQTCPGPGTGAGTGTTDTRGDAGKVETTVIRKTIASLDLPHGWRMKRYRAYLDVTVPVVIRDQAQDILDRCMKSATDSAIAYMVPYVAAAAASFNPGPIVSALPGAGAEALKKFTICVGSNPIIYPYIANNTIKVSAGAGWD